MQLQTTSETKPSSPIEVIVHRLGLPVHELGRARPSPDGLARLAERRLDLHCHALGRNRGRSRARSARKVAPPSRESSLIEMFLRFCSAASVNAASSVALRNVIQTARYEHGEVMAEGEETHETMPAEAVGRGADLLPLLAGKPEEALKRVAAGLWGEQKQQFMDGVGIH